jgi:hypothetical protein
MSLSRYNTVVILDTEHHPLLSQGELCSARRLVTTVVGQNMVFQSETYQFS